MESSALLEYLKEKRTRYNLNNRMNETKANRRSNRTSAVLKKRNIGVMTPIVSPIVKKTNLRQAPPSKTKLQSNISPRTQLQFNAEKPEKKEQATSRMQKFKEWQKEKQKRLLEEKQKAKPVFKVHHISTPATYDLKAVYNNIKGKSVDVFRKKNGKAELVPIGNHTFKAPSNIRAIPLEVVGAVKKPNLQPKIAHHMNLRSKKVASSAELPTSKKSGAPKTKVAPKKAYKPASMKTASQPKGSFVIEGKMLHVVTENIPISKITEHQKLPLTNAKLNGKRIAQKSFVQITEQLHPTPPLVVEIPDSEEEEKGKSVVKETRSKRRRSSVKKVEKSPFKIARRTRQSDSVAVLSSDELPKESETKNTKRRNDIIPLTELNSSNSSLSTAYTIDANSSLSDVPVTPKNKDTFIAYVSPFVTMSRGKENARHEHHRRSMLHVDDDTKSTSPTAAAQYFTRILEEQNEQLAALCAKWTTYKLENSAEEVHDMINVAIGQTELLRNKKFKQFRDLIELCKSGNSEKPIKALDLHGYYDTMQIQIVNLQKRFENLEQLKGNNWEEIAPPPKKAKTNKPKKLIKKAKPSMALRAMIEAKRKQLTARTSNVNVDETVQTPKSKRISSLRLSVGESLKKKRISSPGLTIMKVTRSAKSRCSTPNLTNTQPKSILKSEVKMKRKSLRKSKMVLFEVSPGSSSPFS